MESRSSIMDIFPVEILDLIIHHCELQSLKQLRSVNQLFHKLSTPQVFEHVCMAIFEDSFEKFSALAKSKFAQHVKRFTLVMDILPNWTQKQWERSIHCGLVGVPRTGSEYILAHQRTRVLCQNPEGTSMAVEARSVPVKRPEDSGMESPRLTDSELDAGWREFRRLRNEQHGWWLSDMGIAFKEAFALLPNIIEAEALVTVPFLGSAEHMDVWARGEQRVPGVRPIDFPLNTDYRNDPVRRKLSGRLGLMLLEAIGFRSSFAGTTQITKLALHVVHRETFRDLVLPSSSSVVEKLTLQESTRLHMAQDVFCYLTAVNLQIPHAIDCWRPGQKQSSTELCALLSSAQNLRKLTLFCKERKTEAFIPPVQCHLLTLLSQVPQLWPHIEHLSLCIDTPSGVLLSFLEKVASSLRSLELRDMLVEDVLPVVQQIPKILNLHHVYIQSIWHGSHHDIELELAEPYIRVLPLGTDIEEAKDVGEEKARDLKAYLLGKLEKMPDLYHLGDVWVRRD